MIASFYSCIMKIKSMMIYKEKKYLVEHSDVFFNKEMQQNSPTNYRDVFLISIFGVQIFKCFIL